MDPAHPNNWVGSVFLIALIAFMFALRLRRMQRGRRLRLEWLWVVPTLYAGVAAFLIYLAPPSPLGWGLAALGFAVGAVLGWQRGRLVAITVDPVSHELSQRESPLVILLIVGVIALRFGLRSIGGAEARAWHVSAFVITDALVMMALGLFAVQRLVLWRRARAALAEARGN